MKQPEHNDLDLEEVFLEDEDFSGRRVEYLGVYHSRLVRCRFERMRVRTASLGTGRQMSEFVECSFDGSRFRQFSPGRARFERCTFRNVALRDCIAANAEFVDCVFSGTLRGVVFYGAPMLKDDRLELGRTTNEFRGNDFSEANLENVGFRLGIDLTAQTLPAGDDYIYIPDVERTLTRAREQVRTWRHEDQRLDAESILKVFFDELADGQTQQFLRLDSFKIPHAVQQKLSQILREPD